MPFVYWSELRLPGASGLNSTEVIPRCVIEKYRTCLVAWRILDHYLLCLLYDVTACTDKVIGRSHRLIGHKYPGVTPLDTHIRERWTPKILNLMNGSMTCWYLCGRTGCSLSHKHLGYVLLMNFFFFFSSDRLRTFNVNFQIYSIKLDNYITYKKPLIHTAKYKNSTDETVFSKS